MSPQPQHAWQRIPRAQILAVVARKEVRELCSQHSGPSLLLLREAQSTRNQARQSFLTKLRRRPIHAQRWCLHTASLLRASALSVRASG